MSFRDVVNIVSGLPRSGTSMMMSMLSVGGIEPLTDEIRKADIDNPKGYYEFEKVKAIKEDDSWLDDAVGRVVKMVSMLLLDLPDNRRYKIVFMRREMNEILASQRKMLKRLGESTTEGKEAAAEDRAMDSHYRKHLVKVHMALSKKKNIELLYIRYNDVLNEPAPLVRQVNDFFGGELDEEKMLSVVDASLYRNRA